MPPDAPDTQHYRSYKEQVLQVGRPNAVTVTRQSEEAGGTADSEIKYD